MFRMPGRQPRLNPDIIRVLWNLFPKSCHKSFCKIHDSDKNTSRNPRPADIVRHSAEAGNYGNPLPNPPRLFHIPRLERRRGFKPSNLQMTLRNAAVEKGKKHRNHPLLRYWFRFIERDFQRIIRSTLVYIRWKKRRTRGTPLRDFAKENPRDP